MPTLVHPSFCSKSICEHKGSDIVHRSVGEVFATTSSCNQLVSVSLVQCDELDRIGVQVSYEADIQVTVEDRHATLSLAEARDLAGLVRRPSNGAVLPLAADSTIVVNALDDAVELMFDTECDGTFRLRLDSVGEFAALLEAMADRGSADA